MGFAEAIEAFTSETPCTAETRESVTLLKSYLASTANSSLLITPDDLRHFLGNWYLSRYVSHHPSAELPTPNALLAALDRLVDWTARRGDLQGEMLIRLQAALDELSVTLTHAIEISGRLVDYVSGRRGPFAFPEFLTTFEQGGRSEYDVDASGEVFSMEGYFTIVRIDGMQVEAVESISEEIIWPITFLEPLASLLIPGYILNLELVRSSEGWQISGCGLAHPPGTPVP